MNPSSLRRFAAVSCLVFATPIALFAAQAGPQRENSHGRTQLPMKVSSNIHFRSIGPAISGGRVTAVAGVAGNPDIYYVGAADGGVFRTDNGGTTWTAEFQHEPVASIGALAVDPQNPSVLWAGTGESNVRNDVSFGDGVYKSTDAGRHWKNMGLKDTFQISRIVINPLHPDTVLVAAMGEPWKDNPDRGVYRTTDGGKTWQKVLYVGPSVGISDMAIDPGNPEIVFAATYRFRRTPWGYSDGGPEDAIYKSIDGGVTWKRLSGHGLPSEPVARIGLAIAASSPNVVYAVMGSNQGVLWRSDDYGDHWTLVSKNQEVDSRPFYFSHIAVDPTDPNRVFAISNNLLESSDGGRHFHTIAKNIHVDHHTMWIDPAGSGRIIEGNDGGVALSLDNGKHWNFIHNIAIGQFYHAATTEQQFFRVCGGLQDNSGWCGPGMNKNPQGILDRDWFLLNGGDGIYAVPAADNPNLVYNSTQNQFLMVFNKNSLQSENIEPYSVDFTGEGVAKLKYRFAWDAGFAVSPDNPKVLYAGGNVLFKSEDRGRTWKVISPDLTLNIKSKQVSSGGPIIKDNSGAEVYDAILRIAVAKSDPKVIWVGTDDGQVQVTRNGGASWTNVTSHIPNLPPWGRVESIDVSPTKPGHVLIAVDRHFSGDFKPYLFRTNDYGASWTSISGNLPSDVYAHVVRRDLKNPNLYYAGLENGLYVSWDAGRKWYLFGLGLPDVAIYDLTLNAQDNDLVLATHGRSIWVLDDLTPFQNFDPQVASAPLTLFQPETAVRYWPWPELEFPGDQAFSGQNPQYGAAFDYYLSKSADKPGELIITNAEGKVVRTLKGLHKGKPITMTPVEETAQAPAAGKAKKKGESAKQMVPWVPMQAGLHRIYWNLRADGPVRWNSALPFMKGPKSGALLPPGTYTATLKIGGQSESQKFTVINDPASGAALAGMQQRYETEEAVLHELSQVDVALNRLHAIHQQLQALKVAVKGEADEAAVTAAIDKLQSQTKAEKLKLTSNAGAEESTLRVPDQIHEHLQMMSGLLEGEDTPPTATLLDQKKHLDGEYQSAIQEFNHFLSTDVTAFNHSMAAHKLTGVVEGTTLQP
ncbi:MAG: hypothetical protein M1568_03975 [Acidobacteria bacterium]|nr:hypothetical protein [Acidobacteriota bacterium]